MATAHELAAAYEAGLDAGRTEPNAINCHYRHFAEKVLTGEWERGKRDGDRELEGKP